MTRQVPEGAARAAEDEAGGIEMISPTSTRTAALSAPRRAALLLVGTVALALGVVGIVVPVLPTTPFLLVTAACYARSSTRLYRWLLGQPSLGPIITEWRASRSLPPGVKPRALVMVALTFAVSIMLVDVVLLQVLLALIGLTLALFLYRLPTSAGAAQGERA